MTIFKEMDEQLAPDVPSLVVVPVGVGSFAHAVVAHYKRPGRPATRVLAVEPEAAACLGASLDAGKCVSVETGDTIMAGMCCGTLSSIAWDYLKNGVDFHVTITDLEAHRAVRYLQSEGVSAGPCGAAALAALEKVVRLDPRLMGLDEDAVVVLLCTEGTRSYDVPVDDG